MKNVLLLSVTAITLIVIGCAPPRSDYRLNSTEIQVRQEAEQAADDAINPWLVQPQLTLIRHQVIADDELPVSDEDLRDMPEIQFTASPVTEPIATPEPDESPDALSAGFVSDEQVQRNVQNSQYAGLSDSVDRIEAKLDAQATLLDAIANKIVSADEMRTIVSEELDKFSGKLKVDYKLSTTDETKTKEVPITHEGTGQVSLPPGAIVTAIGGVPVAQWRAENPDAVVLDNSVKSNGSSGGSSGSVSMSTTQSQVLMPMTTTYYESTIPISQQPIVAPTEYYSSPGQFNSSVSSYPDSTQVQFEVSNSYLPTASTECYTDQNGNQVCPVNVNAPVKASGGLLSRFRERRGR